MTSQLAPVVQEGIYTHNCIGVLSIRDAREFYDLVTAEGQRAYVKWDTLPSSFQTMGEVSGLYLRYDYGRSPERADLKRALNIRGVYIRPGIDSTNLHRTPTHRAVIVRRLIHYGVFGLGTPEEQEVEIGFEWLPKPLIIRTLADIPAEWIQQSGYDLKELRSTVLAYMGNLRALSKEVIALAKHVGFHCEGSVQSSNGAIVPLYAALLPENFSNWQLRYDTGATAEEIVQEAGDIYRLLAPANQLFLIESWINKCEPTNEWTLALKEQFEEAWRMWYRDASPQEQPQYARIIGELALRILFLSLFHRFKGIMQSAMPHTVLNGMLSKKKLRWRGFNVALYDFEQEYGGFAPEVYAFIQDHLVMGAARLHCYGFHLSDPPTLERVFQAHRNITAVELELSQDGQSLYNAVQRMYTPQQDF